MAVNYDSLHHFVVIHDVTHVGPFGLRGIKYFVTFIALTQGFHVQPSVKTQPMYIDFRVWPYLDRHSISSYNL